MKGEKQLLQIVLTYTQDMGLHAQECTHRVPHTHAHTHTSTCTHALVGSKNTKQTKRNFFFKKNCFPGQELSILLVPATPV